MGLGVRAHPMEYTICVRKKCKIEMNSAVKMQQLPWSGLSRLRDGRFLLSSMGPYSDMMVSFLVAQRSTRRNESLILKRTHHEGGNG